MKLVFLSVNLNKHNIMPLGVGTETWTAQNQAPSIGSTQNLPSSLSQFQNQGGTIGQLANIAQLSGFLSPYFSQLSNQNITPTAQTIQGSLSSITPQQLQMLNSMYAQYGPQLAETSGNVQLASQQAAANANTQTLNSSQGQGAIQAALAADQQVNPEAYATRTATGNALQNLLASDGDLSGQLSGSETRAIQQSLAQQGVQNGTTNIPSATQTVSNAMQYGNATYQRQQQAKSNLSDAISKATTFIPQANNNNVNAWAVGTGNQGSGNASNLFGGAINSAASQVNSAVGAANPNTSSSLYSTGAGLQAGNNATSASQSGSNAGAIGGIIGGLGALISAF